LLKVNIILRQYPRKNDIIYRKRFSKNFNGHFEGIIDKVCKDQRAKDQFQVLAPYFGFLTIDQLVGEDLDAFPSMVNNDHKIIISVFVHRYLAPLIESQNHFRNERYCNTKREN
jgi:hypothetical protein